VSDDKVEFEVSGMDGYVFIDETRDCVFLMFHEGTCLSPVTISRMKQIGYSYNCAKAGVIQSCHHSHPRRRRALGCRAREVDETPASAGAAGDGHHRSRASFLELRHFESLRDVS
jgi:hypothetical protein